MIRPCSSHVYESRVLRIRSRRDGTFREDNVVRKFNDLRIREKVMLAFAVILCVTAGLGAFSIERLSAVNTKAADIRDNWMPATVVLGMVWHDTMRYRQIEATALLAPTPELREKELKTLPVLMAAVAKELKDAEPLATNSDEQRLTEAVESGWTAYLGLSHKIFDLSAQGDRDGAYALYVGEARTIFNKFGDTLAQDIEYNRAGGIAAANTGAALYVGARNYILIALSAAVLLCIAIGYGMVCGISRPITAMVEAMKKLAGGDTNTSIPAQGRKDEVGSMADAVQVFKDNMITAARLEAEQKTEQDRKEQRQKAVDSYISDSTSRSAACWRWLRRRRRSWNRRRNRCPRPRKPRSSNRRRLRQRRSRPRPTCRRLPRRRKS
jgi:methyl-accepting chemotaxis protein